MYGTKLESLMSSRLQKDTLYGLPRAIGRVELSQKGLLRHNVIKILSLVKVFQFFHCVQSHHIARTLKPHEALQRTLTISYSRSAEL